MRVGTHVIVVAVILLPVVGPKIQEGQDITSLMRHWYSIVWFSILLVTCAIAGLLLVWDVTRYRMEARVLILLVARAAAIAVNLTVSRAFILGLTDAMLFTFIIIKIVSGAIYTYAIVVQSYTVEQARFVPLNATTIILVNALTGIIIWEDWRVVSSWYGYLCIFVLLGLGCDLLLSVPLLNAENPEFGMGRRTSLMIQNQPDTLTKQHLLIIEPITPDYDSINNHKKLQIKAKQYSYSAPPAQRDRQRTRVDAWKELVGYKDQIQNDEGDTSQDGDDGDGNDDDDDDEPFDEEAPNGTPQMPPLRSTAYITPQRVESAVKETTMLLTQQPLHLEEKLATVATAMAQVSNHEQPGEDQQHNTPPHLPPEPKPHLSRRDAWRETVSPIRAHPARSGAGRRCTPHPPPPEESPHPPDVPI